MTQNLWLKSNKTPIAFGFLACMALWIVLLATQRFVHDKQLAETKQSGLVVLDALEETRSPRSYRARLANYSLAASGGGGGAPEEVAKQIVRTATMNVTADKPLATSDQICALVLANGGIVVNANRSGAAEEYATAHLEVGVPATQIEDALRNVRNLVRRVDSQTIATRDVTKEYVDHEANLRNLHAEEAQYLLIMKRAKNVHDTLEVSQKLSDVRTRIDSEQGELNAIARDVAMSAITIEIAPDAESRVAGIYWRPWSKIRHSFRDGIQEVVEYANSMIALIFILPAIVLWFVTVLVFLVIGFRCVRWAYRRYVRHPAVSAPAA
jgi:hypothetical protein